MLISDVRINVYLIGNCRCLRTTPATVFLRDSTGRFELNDWEKVCPLRCFDQILIAPFLFTHLLCSIISIVVAPCKGFLRCVSDLTEYSSVTINFTWQPFFNAAANQRLSLVEYAVSSWHWPVWPYPFTILFRSSDQHEHNRGVRVLLLILWLFKQQLQGPSN